DRARVDAQGAHRRRPRGTRLYARHVRRRPRARPGRGGECLRARRSVSRGRGARHLLRRPRRPAAGPLRPVTRRRWLVIGPAAVAGLFALLVGAVAFRLRGAYFAIGTLALGEILRITVGNVLSEISTLPAATIAGYRLASRYYLALGLATVAVLAVAALGSSRLG